MAECPIAVICLGIIHISYFMDVYMNRIQSPLCLTVLGHQQPQCQLKGSACFLSNLPGFSWYSFSFIDQWQNPWWQPTLCDVTMGTMESQITNLTIVYSTVYSGADQRKWQSSGSLAFVQGIHRSLVNSLHKWPVTRKMFPFDDVILNPIKFCGT